MACGSMVYIYGWDQKEVMPMFTFCPICHKKAINIYAAPEGGETEMDSHSTHEYASKSEYWSIVYTHVKCLPLNKQKS